MILAKSTLSAFFCSMIMLFLAGGEARSQTFDLRVCNKTNVGAVLAIVSRVSAREDKFKAEGWWGIPAGRCGGVGKFTSGWVYFYADAEDGTVWAGEDADICVSDEKFSKVIVPDTPCAANERIASFHGIFVKPDQRSFTLELE